MWIQPAVPTSEAEAKLPAENEFSRVQEVCVLRVERRGEEWVVFAGYRAEGLPNSDGSRTEHHLRTRRVKGFPTEAEAQSCKELLAAALLEVAQRPRRGPGSGFP